MRANGAKAILQTVSAECCPEAVHHWFAVELVMVMVVAMVVTMMVVATVLMVVVVVVLKVIMSTST